MIGRQAVLVLLLHGVLAHLGGLFGALLGFAGWDWFFCDVLNGWGERCPPKTLDGYLRFLFLDEMPYILLFILGQLLVALPGAFLVRDRGPVFATALGACTGVQLAFFSAYSGWAHSSGLGFEPAVERLCGANERLCVDALMVPYLLLWLAYWTLLPALLAAGLMRFGRVLTKSFKQLVWPVG